MEKVNIYKEVLAKRLAYFTELYEKNKRLYKEAEFEYQKEIYQHGINIYGNVKELLENIIKEAENG